MPGHVLATFEFGSINGGENSFLTLIGSLREAGWTFTGLVPPTSPLEGQLHALSIETRPFLPHTADGTRLSQADVRERIATVIEDVQPDLVHCNSLAMSRLCGPVCRSLQVPSLGYLRDIIKISKKAMEDINQLDRIIAVSAATRNYHVDRGLDADRSLVIHNGIDREAFLASAAQPKQTERASKSIREQLEIEPNSQLILYCGQIGMRKGLDSLIDSFVQLCRLRHADRVPLHLLIVGERHSKKQEAIEYEQNLRQQIVAAKLDHQVHWLGRRSDVAAIMQQSTLLMHAARQEPLGRVLLEAGAVGLPIVATNVGGTGEILCGEYLADLLVPCDDAAELATAAAGLLDDPQRHAEISKRLVETIGQRFSIARCAEQLKRQYKTLVTGHTHSL